MGEIGDRVQYWAWVVINIGLLHIPAWLGQGVLFHICQGANVKFGLFTRPGGGGAWDGNSSQFNSVMYPLF